MSSSMHIDNERKDFLSLGVVPIQGLNYTTLPAEAKYPISFTQLQKRFVLSLHYNERNSFILANATKIY